MTKNNTYKHALWVYFAINDKSIQKIKLRKATFEIAWLGPEKKFFSKNVFPWVFLFPFSCQL